jgi:hypothetical protein
MSKMTDRVSNPNLVNIARQKYEQKQMMELPSNTVKLPSKGLVYPESSPLRSGLVDIRYMTAFDEDIVTNSTYIRDRSVYERLLDSIITTPGVSVEDIEIGDRDAILVAARIYSYGERYPVIVNENGEETVKSIDLRKIPHKSFDNIITDENGETDYVIENGDKLKIKFLTVKNTKKLADSEETKSTTLLQMMIAEINGNRDANYIAEYIKYHLIAKESRLLQSYIMNNMPGLVNTELEFEGEDGSTFRTTFQAGVELFWI